MAENNTKLDCLIRLQEKITEKLDQEKQKEIIPEKLGRDTAELNKAKAALEDLNAQLEAAIESEKSLSIQYDDAFAKSQECQRRFEFASSQKQYQPCAHSLGVVQGSDHYCLLSYLAMPFSPSFLF